MNKKNVVKLRLGDREKLGRIVRSGRHSAAKVARARILLKADARRNAWPDARIAEALEVSVGTVERVRRRFVEQGLDAAVERRPQPPRPQKRRLDGAAEAKPVTLACSQPPEGRDRWTLDLLSDRMVKLNHVHGVSRDTVRRVLKKTSPSRG